MLLFRRRDVLAACAGLTGFGVSAAMNGVWAEPAKKSPGKSLAKPTPPFRPKLIALDPGHGGRDPGALGVRGTQEKGVVWTIAGELKQQLMAGGRYRVMLTRAGDSYVALRERVARAQALKADLFLSIHADSHPDPGVRGASVYTLSEEATDREADFRSSIHPHIATAQTVCIRLDIRTKGAKHSEHRLFIEVVE